MNAWLHDHRMTDAEGVDEDFRSDVLAGLQRMPKRLSSKYFYDARGSQLFEDICEQPEYYLTRAELQLMHEHVASMAQACGPDALLVEYGSGSGEKTRLLLAELASPVAYVPVEISAAALCQSVRRLREDFPGLALLPLCADFTQALSIPHAPRHPRRRIVYFPGSTIGNFDAKSAQGLLHRIREQMGANGAALIGVDLKKDPAVMEAAYNDAAGVTAAFTLNMLARFNRELDADFDLDAFRHRARYNALAGRIETHIVSERAQTVRLGGDSIHFAAHEAMLVEYSCKYSLDDFARLAAAAGLAVRNVWFDAARQFSVQLLEWA